MPVDTRSKSVFDLAFPPIAYHDTRDPDEVHRRIGHARRQSPIAMGPYGPELLTYDLVRTALRDSRFAMPQGIGLVVQGISSGPVWDRVCRLLVSLDGAEHQRLRRLVSRAFTPRAAERMQTACVDVITELVDQHAAEGRCDMVTDIAQEYPIPIICALLGAAREDWRLFSMWAGDISKAFGCNVAEDTPVIVRAWEQLDAYVEELIARRRRSLGDDLISDLIRAEAGGDRLTHDELVSLAATCSTRAPTPLATSWPPPCKCCAHIPTNGHCSPSIPNWHRRPSTNSSATPRSSWRHYASPSRTSNSAASSSRRAPAWSPTRRRPTATLPCTTSPTVWTSPAWHRRPC